MHRLCRREWPTLQLMRPAYERKLPVVLSRDEVRLISRRSPRSGLPRVSDDNLQLRAALDRRGAAYGSPMSIVRAWSCSFTARESGTATSRCRNERCRIAARVLEDAPLDGVAVSAPLGAASRQILARSGPVTRSEPAEPPSTGHGKRLALPNAPMSTRCGIPMPPILMEAGRSSAFDSGHSRSFQSQNDRDLHASDPGGPGHADRSAQRTHERPLSPGSSCSRWPISSASTVRRIASSPASA